MRQSIFELTERVQASVEILHAFFEDIGRDAKGDIAKKLIAGVMPEQFVDAPEAIQVEE